MTTLELTLVIVLTILTLCAVVVCVQIVATLRQVKKTLQQIELISDNMKQLTEALANPVSAVAGLLEGMKVVKTLKGFLRKDEE